MHVKVCIIMGESKSGKKEEDFEGTGTQKILALL